MLDLGEVKGVVDKPVHDSRQPDAEFFQGGKLLDFMDIVGVEEKDFPDIRTGVDGGPGKKYHQLHHPGFDDLQIEIAGAVDMTQQLVE